jgi:hypothetical protein
VCSTRSTKCVEHIPVSRGFSKEYEGMGGVFCRVPPCPCPYHRWFWCGNSLLFIMNCWREVKIRPIYELIDEKFVSVMVRMCCVLNVVNWWREVCCVLKVMNWWSEVKIRPIYQCRYDTKVEESTLLTHTGFLGEHLKMKTRLIDEKFVSVMVGMCCVLKVVLEVNLCVLWIRVS